MQKHSLRIVYMGTPDFAVYPLEKLLESGYDIVGVVTNPDKSAGRGLKLQESAVKKYAVAKGLKILQPERFKDASFLQELRALNADLHIVVAFKMLPEEVWGMPELGTINLHASLLPDYRGAAPINRVIMNGEKITGVSTFLLNHGMDAGKILLREQVDIGTEMTAGELHDRLMAVGAEVLVKTVKLLESGNYLLTDQDVLLFGREAIHAPKLFKEEMRVNWNADNDTVYNHIRGLSPFPAAWTALENTQTGEKWLLKIFTAKKYPVNGEGLPGDIYTDGKEVFRVRTQNGMIGIEELQLSGKKRMGTLEFLRGFSLVGCKFS